ncbi:MAG: carboxypeptidase M32 [Alphaproteobacteria bacterium]|nr:carboxypeptidase M32 [Alphaproteobacteria bacterium]
MTPYQELETRFRRLANLNDAREILHWDTATIMPQGGAEARADQLATLSVLAHEMLTAPEVKDLLDAAEGAAPWQDANLREMRRQWVHAAAVPADLVEALSKACSTCEMVWREARPASDFAMVRPALAEVLRLVRETGAAKAEILGCPVYDALLDEYEPDGRAADIDPLFDDLAAFLTDFIDEAIAHQTAAAPALDPEGPFPIAIQEQLGARFMKVLGFDFHHGRLDTSLHPFCGGTPDDVRITTRYDESDFTQSLMGVLHETGHALYERGLPRDWRHQPVGSARGMSLHESQSLLIEMQACRSRAFLGYAAPIIRQAFGGEGPAWDANNLYGLYTRVERGYIRVDADEVTYPAHVIHRYRLEKAMIAGDLQVDDLPAAWNDGMVELLGITPPDDRRGCLQDIHWYDGAWGYFPTYTLGAMTAAQLYDAATRADPGIVAAIGLGDFGPLLAWLGEHVHARGSLLTTRELITEATGRPLDPAVFKTHLKTRYLS